MNQDVSIKVVVSNKAALKSVYGNDFRFIEEALNKLIESGMFHKSLYTF